MRDILFNNLSERGQELSNRQIEVYGAAAPHIVRPYVDLWGKYSFTPLLSLRHMSAEYGLGNVFLKDEGFRLGAGSFKALGGAYAVMQLLRKHVEVILGRELSPNDLLSPESREIASGITVCCATDGNHGKSVAAGARLIGCKSVIFIHAGVTAARAKAIGADETIVVDGSYDDSVRFARSVATKNNWILVSDTSWEGYEDTPAIVGQGYTLLASEALEQIQSLGSRPPTHVFLQAGVGGFAASIAAHLVSVLSKSPPKIIVVEPDRAACLQESVRQGSRRELSPSASPTIMAMLECYAPSLIAYDILARVADVFVTVSDQDAVDAMRELAFPRLSDIGVVAGESGAAGLAGLHKLLSDGKARDGVNLNSESRVLLVNTECDTDPTSYAGFVGAPSSTIRARAQFRTRRARRLR